MAEIKSVPDFKCISPKQISMMISSKNTGFGTSIYIQIPRVKQPVPFLLYFVHWELFLIRKYVRRLFWILKKVSIKK